jgi:hypothetical protein
VKVTAEADRYGQRRPEPGPTSVMAATASTLMKLLAGLAWFGRIVSMV